MVGFMRRLGEAGLTFKDLHTTQSSLEDIFVDLVKREAA
jgi:ABC-2 type transport system ATP-binding protein